MDTLEKMPEAAGSEGTEELDLNEENLDEEKTREASVRRIEEERDYYINWAKSFGKNEAWVNETFTFHEDGKVTCEGNLDLRGVTKLSSFPPDIMEVTGNLDLRDIASLQDIHLPKEVQGSLYLNQVAQLDGVRLPRFVGGAVELSRLQTIAGLTLPEYIGGGLWLNSLESLDQHTVQWPKHIGGDVYLQLLEDWERDQVREQMREQRCDAVDRLL